MKRASVLAVAGFLTVVVAAAAVGVWVSGKDKPGPTPTHTATPMTETTTYRTALGRTVVVTRPMTNAVVTSPLRVLGEVPGPWSFEASFGVEIQDAHHKQVAEHYATVQGDWMTEKDVPFTAEVTFKPPATESGFLVLHNANPSGDQSHDDSVEIPIRFRN